MILDSQKLEFYTSYGILVGLSFLSVYSGCIGSIYSMKKPDNAPRTEHSGSPLEDSDDEEAIENLTPGQSFVFPLIGSAALFFIHFMYNYVHKDYVDYALTVYFSFVGYAAVSKASMDFVKTAVPSSLLKSVDRYKVTISKRSKNLSYFHFTLVHIIILWSSIMLSAYYSLTKNWVVSNLFALSIVRSSIQLFSLESFGTGFLLTSGLFVYDIFWVFYPPMQALSSLDLPVRLVWPESRIDGFSRLGLGDMIVPGLLIALALRYDRDRTWKSNPTGLFRSLNFSKPYFIVSLLTFVLGMTVSFVTQQPTFLFVGPACALSLTVTSLVLGEDLFAYRVFKPLEAPRVAHRKIPLERKVPQAAQPSKQSVQKEDTIDAEKKSEQNSMEQQVPEPELKEPEQTKPQPKESKQKPVETEKTKKKKGKK